MNFVLWFVIVAVVFGRGTEGSLLTEAEMASTQQAIVEVQQHINNQPNARHSSPPVNYRGKDSFSVTVNMIFSLVAVLSLDDAQQMMSSMLYVQLWWYDKTLAWNASDFQDVPLVELPGSALWTPDIFFANAVEPRNILTQSNTFSIHSDGKVRTSFIMAMDSHCNMEHEQFPFDTQHCSLIAVSYSYFVDIQLYVINLDRSLMENYLRKSEWEFVSQSMQPLAWTDGIILDSVRVELRRRTTFYTVCLLVPMVLTSYMNTLVFLVPLEAGEKVSFLVAIFISTSVFTSFLASVMPRSLDVVPMAMKLLVAVMAQSLVVLLGTLLVLGRRHPTPRPPHPQHCPTCDPKRPHTADKRTADDDGRLWCCSRDQGRGVVRVRPAVEGEQEGQECEEKGRDQDYREGSGLSALTAERLDRLFFLLSFCANTVIMWALLLDSGAHHQT